MVKGKVMLVGVALAFTAVAIAGIASEARLSTVLWRGLIAAALAGGVAYMAGALLDATALSHLPKTEDTESDTVNEPSQKKDAEKDPPNDKKEKKDAAKSSETEAATDEGTKDNGASTEFKPMNDEGLTHLTAS